MTRSGKRKKRSTATGYTGNEGAAPAPIEPVPPSPHSATTTSNDHDAQGVGATPLSSAAKGKGKLFGFTQEDFDRARAQHDGQTTSECVVAAYYAEVTPRAEQHRRVAAGKPAPPATVKPAVKPAVKPTSSAVNKPHAATSSNTSFSPFDGKSNDDLMASIQGIYDELHRRSGASGPPTKAAPPRAPKPAFVRGHDDFDEYMQDINKWMDEVNEADKNNTRDSLRPKPEMEWIRTHPLGGTVGGHTDINLKIKNEEVCQKLWGKSAYNTRNLPNPDRSYSVREVPADYKDP